MPADPQTADKTQPDGNQPDSMPAEAGPRLVDSHCHLDFPQFAEERAAILDRARAAGVGHMLTICCRPSQIAETRAIAAAHDDISCAIGVHPHEAGREGDISRDALIELVAATPSAVAIGESGLDYHYDHAPRDAQQTSFRRHCHACRATGLPLVVHSREAEADTAAILRAEATAEAGAHPLTGVLHCFSGTEWLAREGLDLGFYVSFSGIVTFKNSHALRDVARAVPLDRLLVETDAPYLAPVPHRGRRNEPAFVTHTAEILASVKGVTLAELTRRTTANFYRLFPRAARTALPPSPS